MIFFLSFCAVCYGGAILKIIFSLAFLDTQPTQEAGNPTTLLDHVNTSWIYLPELNITHSGNRYYFFEKIASLRDNGVIRFSHEGRLHGNLGHDASGQPLWVPKPLNHTLSHEEKVLAHQGYCFNSRVSDSLPLDRHLPDFRPSECPREYHQRKDFPKVTVIFVFYNELLSVLLRSIHSVLNRSPPDLLEHIILVNDASDKTTHPWLYQPLEKYITSLPKTTLLHLTERRGLMGARMFGALHATTDVLVFLDSHIEATQGWLEPLVVLIHEDPKTVVTPTIGGIDAETFTFHPHGIAALSFTWSLGQAFLRGSSGSEPFPSAIMAGGLFAISRWWFHEIGEYDKEMMLYGGEEVEIGLKINMCGGKLLVQPCSIVGHVFRVPTYWAHQVYTVPFHYILRNKLRVAEVWLDEYAPIAKATIGSLPSTLSLGPLDEVRKVRQRLNCKPFKWFLKNLAINLEDPFAFPGSSIGSVRFTDSNLCIDTYQETEENKPVRVYPCHYHNTQIYIIRGNFVISPISHLQLCLADDPKNPTSVIYSLNCTSNCWHYNNTSFQLHNTCLNSCLQQIKDSSQHSFGRLSLQPCSNHPDQKVQVSKMKTNHL